MQGLKKEQSWTSVKTETSLLYSSPYGKYIHDLKKSHHFSKATSGMLLNPFVNIKGIPWVLAEVSCIQRAF